MKECHNLKTSSHKDLLLPFEIEDLEGLTILLQAALIFFTTQTMGRHTKLNLHLTYAIYHHSFMCGLILFTTHLMEKLDDWLRPEANEMSVVVFEKGYVTYIHIVFSIVVTNIQG